MFSWVACHKNRMEENWNQHRIDRRLARVLLAEILSNLEEDLRDVHPLRSGRVK